MLYVVLAVVVACACALSEDQYRDEFNLFKKEFSKAYSTAQEESERLGVFKANLDFISKHNEEAKRGEHKFTVGVNQYADLTIGEFSAMYLRPFNRTSTYNPVRLPEASPPTSIDWRTKGAVTPVKNQGQCGSCWSFSTTGSTEGIHQIKTGTLVSLSEQQLMDCSTAEGNQGCNGGLMDYAFEYIIKNGGLDSEADYPYTAEDGTCNKAKAANHVATITAYQDVPHDEESQLLAAAANQPVSVAIEADQSAFQLYKTGVFDAKCGTNLDHGVLVVGYGSTSANVNYWIVKNSWGATWGDEGYIYMERGVGSTGICGIAMEPSYPTLSSEEKLTLTLSSSVGTNPTHYGDPTGGCMAGEEAVQVTGVTGDFCSPACSAKKPCPTDYPAGTGSSVKGECILEKAGASSATNCALVCQPSSSTGCPTKASCKSISVIGICTYNS